MKRETAATHSNSNDEVSFVPLLLIHVQDGFCLFMALWAAQFCENYNRSAIIQAAVWGTRNYDNVASIRPGYQEHGTTASTLSLKSDHCNLLGCNLLNLLMVNI